MELSGLSKEALIDQIISLAKSINIGMTRGCLYRGVIETALFGPAQWSQLLRQLELVNELRRRNNKPLLTRMDIM